MEDLFKPEVTKEWLSKKLEDLKERDRVIGRALLAIYKNQTLSEQSTDSTKQKNNIGFCKPDARVGSIGARMYRSKAKLEPWVVEVWMRPAKDGFPRICKYADQLNSIAGAKYMELVNRKPFTNVLKNVVML